MSESPILSISNGEVRAWVEQRSSIHLKAVAAHGDPVELTATQARLLVTGLLELIARLEAEDEGRT